jgi:hypothetical protein
MTAAEIKVDGEPVAAVSASGSPGKARLLGPDGKPIPDGATVTISARLLAEAFVGYAQQGANGLAAAQAGEAAKRQVQAMGNAVLYAAAAAAGRG